MHGGVDVLNHWLVSRALDGAMACCEITNINHHVCNQNNNKQPPFGFYTVGVDAVTLGDQSLIPEGNTRGKKECVCVCVCVCVLWKGRHPKEN